jgi:endonuclease G
MKKINALLILLLLQSVYLAKDKYDLELRNNYFTIYYSTKFKSPVAAYTLIDGSKIDKKNIKKRPSFKIDKRIKRLFRTKTSEYTNSGYDRGHFGASDASFDYSKESLDSTYLMSNVVPQTKETNRKAILSIENRIRSLARKYKSVGVTTLAFINSNSKELKNHIKIPDAFGKIIILPGNLQKECFYVLNKGKHKKNYKYYSYSCDKLISKWELF